MAFRNVQAATITHSVFKLTKLKEFLNPRRPVKSHIQELLYILLASFSINVLTGVSEDIWLLCCLLLLFPSLIILALYRRAVEMIENTIETDAPKEFETQESLPRKPFGAIKADLEDRIFKKEMPALRSWLICAILLIFISVLIFGWRIFEDEKEKVRADTDHSVYLQKTSQILDSVTILIGT